MSWWSESGVFKQQRHAKCAERGGARTGVENRWFTQQWHFESLKTQSWKWHEFVQTVASCTCILRVQSIGVQVRSVSLESDIANNWPGMQYTAFLVVFPDPCEQGKLFKNTKEKLFSTLLQTKLFEYLSKDLTWQIQWLAFATSQSD